MIDEGNYTMYAFEPVALDSGDLTCVSLIGYRETIFFSTRGDNLCQWIELRIRNEDSTRKLLMVRIELEGRKQESTAVIRRGEVVVRCFAPCVWPEPPMDAAITFGVCGEIAAGKIRIGTSRPWEFFLLSDACVDDTWAYADLATHDRDDYLTTAAELALAADNRYNLPATYQLARFLLQATDEELYRLKLAVGEGRLYVSPIPNQFLCGAMTLSAYPLVLYPYRRYYEAVDPGFRAQRGAAYHMEGPSWTNGLVDLLERAGFKVFGKSLLRFLAPWIDALESLPPVTRLETAPGRYCYLVLRPEDYFEGFPILAGTNEADRLLHGEIIPKYIQVANEYPAAVVPIVGLYSDLNPELPGYCSVKREMVCRYNGREWDYPRLVDASWNEFCERLLSELGDPMEPKREGLVTVRGGIGSSWEAWMISAQTEYENFRRVQRESVSLQTLCALLEDDACSRLLNDVSLEVVELADHAWNGKDPAGQRLNSSIRKNRLSRIDAALRRVRKDVGPKEPLQPQARFAVFNGLPWTRACRLKFDRSALPDGAVLVDANDGTNIPLRMDTSDRRYCIVPDVPAYGYRVLTVAQAKLEEHAEISSTWRRESAVRENVMHESMVRPALHMEPMLTLADREIRPEGGWSTAELGEWRVGPFVMEAEYRPEWAHGCYRLSLRISGSPPEDSYELRWRIELPWKRVKWRGESGGGFVTRGSSESGGNCLLGITAAVFSAGEGLCVADVDSTGRIDLAFLENGMCGLGGTTLRAASGGYGEKVPKEIRTLSVAATPETDGILEVFLLGTRMNYKEALKDQGGSRSWT